MRDSPRHRFVQPAFNLIEVVIVVVIIGTVAAIVVPQYASTLVRYRAESAARRIIGDLAYARGYALDRSATQAVQFNLLANNYTLPGVDDLKNSGVYFTVDLSDEPYRVTLQDIQLGGDDQVIFDGFGQPDSGGSITIRIGDVVKVIVMDADSGKASVQ